MVRNPIKNNFRSSKMAAGSHIVKKKKKLPIDLKWREMRSKVIFSHPKWPPAAILWKKKLRIDLKWREMHSKVIFCHPKWPLAAILWKKKKVAYWSEMARNAIKSDFRSSKMAAGNHFVKKKLGSDLKWWEIRSKIIFGHPKWPLAAILWKKKKICLLIWNDEKCDRKWFSVIQNGRQQPFCEKKSYVLIWNGEKCDRKWFSVIQNGRRQPFCGKEKVAYCWMFWNGEKCDRNSFSVIQNGGGGGHHNGQPVNHSGIYTVFALGQIHQFWFIFKIAQ